MFPVSRPPRAYLSESRLKVVYVHFITADPRKCFSEKWMEGLEVVSAIVVHSKAARHLFTFVRSSKAVGFI